MVAISSVTAIAKSKPKPCPKHPVEVHVWAGISMLGATDIYIFTGTMDAQFYEGILEDSFLRQNFAGCEHQMQEHPSCVED